MYSNRPLGRLLIVDDEPLLVSLLGRCFGDGTYAVDAAGGVEEALALIARQSYDVAVVDKNMPGREHPTEGGLEVIRALRERSPGCESIVITGYPDAASAIAALRAGACDYILKPFTPDRIRRRVEEIMNQRGLLDREALGPALHALRGALLDDVTGAAPDDDAERVARYEARRAAFRRVVDAFAYRDRRIIAGMEIFARLAARLEELAEATEDNDRAAALIARMRDLVAMNPCQGDAS